MFWQIFKVVVGIPNFTCKLVNFDFIWNLCQQANKTDVFHCFVVSNPSALRKLSLFYVSINDYKHAAEASYKAIATLAR